MIHSYKYVVSQKLPTLFFVCEHFFLFLSCIIIMSSIEEGLKKFVLESFPTSRFFGVFVPNRNPGEKKEGRITGYFLGAGDHDQPSESGETVIHVSDLKLTPLTARSVKSCYRKLMADVGEQQTRLKNTSLVEKIIWTICSDHYVVFSSLLDLAKNEKKVECQFVASSKCELVVPSVSSRGRKTRIVFKTPHLPWRPEITEGDGKSLTKSDPLSSWLTCLFTSSHFTSQLKQVDVDVCGIDLAGQPSALLDRMKLLISSPLDSVVLSFRDLRFKYLMNFRTAFSTEILTRSKDCQKEEVLFLQRALHLLSHTTSISDNATLTMLTLSLHHSKELFDDQHAVCLPLSHWVQPKDHLHSSCIKICNRHSPRVFFAVLIQWDTSNGPKDVRVTIYLEDKFCVLNRLHFHRAQQLISDCFGLTIDHALSPILCDLSPKVDHLQQRCCFSSSSGFNPAIILFSSNYSITHWIESFDEKEFIFHSNHSEGKSVSISVTKTKMNS